MKFANRESFGWPARSGGGFAPCDQGLVVHYDGSNQGLAKKPHSACVAYWKNTRKFHMGSQRGWSDIGYSFGVCPHGWVFEGRGWQRSQAAQPGGNSSWTSCTFMSGPSEAPTAEQINAFKELRAWLRGKGLKAGIKGHRDFLSTSCPGNKLYTMVKNGSLAGAPAEEDDMPSADEVAKAVWKYNIDAPWVAKGGDRSWQADTHLRVAHSHIRDAEDEIAKLHVAIAELTAVVRELAEKLPAEPGDGS